MSSTLKVRSLCRLGTVGRVPLGPPPLDSLVYGVEVREKKRRSRKIIDSGYSSVSSDQLCQEVLTGDSRISFHLFLSFSHGHYNQTQQYDYPYKIISPSLPTMSSLFLFEIIGTGTVLILSPTLHPEFTSLTGTSSRQRPFNHLKCIPVT